MVQIQPLGENAVILLLSYDDTSKSVAAVRQVYRKIKDATISGITSLRPGLDCLLVEFEDPAVPERLETELQNFKPSTNFDAESGEIVRIPICYDPEFGTDLSSVSKQTGMSVELVVKLHASAVYKVWMIGFMPGFPYLGKLPSELHLPRKAMPDPKLPAGSVAIAEEFIGVYPFDSPGGWHVLGRTPLRLADYYRSDPWLFHYGMTVQFYPVTKIEFEQLKGK
jgi:KipI family sensor histidine kinase inhibitor